MINLRVPLFGQGLSARWVTNIQKVSNLALHVLEAGRGDKGEADQKDVGLRV